MSQPQPARMIELPNELADKVAVLEGVALDTLVQKADREVEKLAGEFEDRARADIDALKQTSRQLGADAEDAQPALRAILATASSLQNQSAICGYPLVSEVTRLMCRLVEGLDSVSDDSATLIWAQIDALDYIIAQRIRDENAPFALSLLADLKVAITKVRAEG